MYPRQRPDLLEKAYQSDLRHWIEQTGQSQRELAALTAYFPVHRDSQPVQLSESTFSRTLQKIPSRNGVYNLIAVLGVLLLKGQVNRSDIVEFFGKYEIALPQGKSWDIVFDDIERGIQQARTNANPQESEAFAVKSANFLSQTRDSKRTLRFAIVALAAAIIGFVLFAVSRHNEPSNQPADCNRLIPETAPVFLPEQGYSLFQSVTTSPSSSILSNNVRTIGLGADALWVGYIPTNGPIDRVSRYVHVDDQNYWTHSCLGIELFPMQNVNDIVFYNNRVYIATDGAGVGEYRDGQWQFYSETEGLPSKVIYSLTVDSQGELWAATYGGVANFQGGMWRTIYRAAPNELTGNHVAKFREDLAGNRWFAILDQGISRLSRDNEWFSYYSNDPNLNETRGIVVDIDGGVWFSTEKGGVLHYKNDRWTIFNVAQGQLPSDTVHDIEIDKYGRIWVATAGGLVYTSDSGSTWQLHSTADTLDIEFGCLSCIYNEDHLWLVAKNRGVGHVRIPPPQPTVRFVEVPSPVVLTPGEAYVFNVTVEVIAEQLTAADGDSLRSIAPIGSFLYGAYPIIPVIGRVPIGERFTFSNIDDPIIAPSEPGIYELEWRVWQGRRFASEPITIGFRVLPNP